MRPGDQRVVAGTAGEGVALPFVALGVHGDAQVCAAVDDVGPETSRDPVGSGAAAQRVVSAEPFDAVVSSATPDDVTPRCPAQVVRAACPGDGHVQAGTQTAASALAARRQGEAQSNDQCPRRTLTSCAVHVGVPGHGAAAVSSMRVIVPDTALRAGVGTARPRTRPPFAPAAGTRPATQCVRWPGGHHQFPLVKQSRGCG